MSSDRPSEAPVVVVQVRGDERVEPTTSLRSWLHGDDALRGRVHRVEHPPPPGTLGVWSDVVAVALGPGGVAVALAGALTYWLRSRSSTIKVTARRQDGAELELSAERVRRIDAAGLSGVVEGLSRWLDGGPHDDTVAQLAGSPDYAVGRADTGSGGPEAHAAD